MIAARHVVFMVLSGACAALAQTMPDRIVLPADKADATLLLPLRVQPAAGAKVTLEPVVDAKDVPLSTQPVFETPAIVGDKLQLTLSKIFFWGEAKLKVHIAPDSTYIYVFERGPYVAKPVSTISRGKAAEIWLYNFDTQPLSVRWRILSGGDTICGNDAKGKAIADCGSPTNWATTTIGPVSSEPIRFAVPNGWFNLLWGGVRRAQLDLGFGSAAASPLLRVPIGLRLDGYLAGKLNGLVPPSYSGAAYGLIRVTFWVTLGAVLLMLAQVMIPNFRKRLKMENDVEALEERLKAISSDVGSRLYTRCQQELESVRGGLVMRQSISGSAFINRVALSGNTTEVNRLAGIIPRIETRISLTESLDERQSAVLDFDSGDIPPSFCWSRARQIRNVRAILSKQFVTEADQKSASASLDLLADDAASLKDFATDLEVRVAGLRRLYATEPFKSKYAALTGALNGCAEMLQPNPPGVPEGGWSDDELMFRDLCAVRLEILVRVIEMEALLALNPPIMAKVLDNLRSDDPSKLAETGIELDKLSQGISTATVSEALASGMWDVYSEPATVTDQDVLRLSFKFRNSDIEQSTAKKDFKCYWSITYGGGTSASSEDGDVYESGWYAQFIPGKGSITIKPRVYDASGKEVDIRSGDNKDRGTTTCKVSAPQRNALHNRLLRGLTDAALTALVPVITVALTQLQSGLSISKLVMLGFTSQAIRAAVVPESVPSTTTAPPAKTAAASSTS
jgi:hypothetical protein